MLVRKWSGLGKPLHANINNGCQVNPTHVTCLKCIVLMRYTLLIHHTLEMLWGNKQSDMMDTCPVL